MKKLALVLSSFLCLGLSVMAQTGEKNFIDQNYIEVNGTAVMEVVPNLIYLKIVIGDKDQKGKVGVEQLESKMFDMLKKLGIDLKKDLSVRDVASNLKSYVLKSSEIRTTKEYVLLLRNTELLNKVFLGLDKIGISDASVERVDHTDMPKFRRQVKVDAIKVAKEKAEDLTAAIGQGIGRALYINETVWSRPMAQNMSNVLLDYEGRGKMNQSLEFEKIKLEATVMVRFELK
jgi:hypothetical protein